MVQTLGSLGQRAVAPVQLATFALQDQPPPLKTFAERELFPVLVPPSAQAVIPG